jgi:hypothetical protein
VTSLITPFSIHAQLVTPAEPDILRRINEIPVIDPVGGECADVSGKAGADLLAIAPGEEILQAVYEKYAGRGYGKRTDGPVIARSMAPPEEIDALLKDFLTEEDDA